MELSTMTFDQAVKLYNDRKLSQPDMRSFAHRWTVGKGSYKSERGLVWELHTSNGVDVWIPMSGDWNLSGNINNPL